MRLNYIVNINGVGAITSVVFDLTAESEREELLLRIIERGEIKDKLSCRLQDGKMLSTTIIIEPAMKTTYIELAWAPGTFKESPN